MITTVVPAEITSHEDTIIGNISLTQIVLLIMPVIIATAIIVIIPPFIKLTIVKILAAVIFGLPLIALSIRYKGETMLRRLILDYVYRSRPRIYVPTIKYAKKETKENNNHQAEIKAEAKNKPIIDQCDESVILSSLNLSEDISFFSDKEGRLGVQIKTS